MADHRREQVLDQIKSLVSGLATTGSNVFRGPKYELRQDQLPAVVVNQGPDQLMDDHGGSAMTEVYSTLTAYLDVIADDSNEEAAEAEVNQIQLELTKILAADYTLGLAFVENSYEGDTQEPQRDSEGHVPLRMGRLEWHTLYNRSRQDPSTG